MKQVPRQKEILGIVGGLGPFAHIDFERKLLECARTLIGAEGDQDFPEWILSSVPQTPDRTLAILGQAESPVPWMVRSLKRLQGANGNGADFAAIPCNTAHQYLEELRSAVTIPILDMIAGTTQHLASTHPRAKVGVLATTGTLESGLYREALLGAGLTPLSLLEVPGGAGLQRRLVMEPIYGPFHDGRFIGGGIKSGGKTRHAQELLTAGASKLVAQGAEVIIAGCTEIPVALDGAEVAGVPLVDPGRVLAELSIRRAYGL